MFERNKVDNADSPGIPVEIVADSGDTLKGRILVSANRNLAEALNSPGGFIEFEPWAGERILIAKSSLRSVKPTRTPKPASLGGRVATLNDFDPFAILGVTADSSHDEVKSAWHRLSKTYHPDRYAAAELPAEVLDYLSAMARRINSAYAALEAPVAAERRAEILVGKICWR
jgi:hypothetical protein